MLWVCLECTTAYTPQAPACPHCGATDCYEQGDETMAKITRKTGVSDAARNPPSETPTEDAADDTPTEDVADETPEAPALSASKDEWIAHARTLGASDEDVAGTKADIQAWVDAQG